MIYLRKTSIEYLPDELIRVRPKLPLFVCRWPMILVDRRVKLFLGRKISPSFPWQQPRNLALQPMSAIEMYVFNFITVRKRNCGKVNVSTPVCQSFWGGLPQCMLGYTTAPGQNPPGQTLPRQTTHWANPPRWVDTPWTDTPQGRPPPRQTSAWADPPADGHCSGWYASYWNAFLFLMIFR